MLRALTGGHNMHVKIVVILGISSLIDVVEGDCIGLPVVNNSFNDAPPYQIYASGFVANISCKQGFNTIGTSRSFICNESSWINGNIKCEPIYCGHIDAPVNGRIDNSPDYGIGTQIVFVCNTGYKQKGASSLTCRIDGQWNQSPPTCEITFCPDFGSVPNGSHFQDSGEGGMNSYESIERVKCKDGYLLNGSPNVYCNKDGQWSGKPQCEPISCPAYPGLNSSCIDNVINIGGKLLYILCFDNSANANLSVTKTGPVSVDCIDNKWTDIFMACYCDCKINVDPTFVKVSGLSEKGFLKHGDTLQWKCMAGSRKENDNHLVCFDGKMPKPRCISTTTQTLLNKTDLMTTQTPLNKTDPMTTQTPLNTMNPMGSSKPDPTTIILCTLGIVVFVAVAALAVIAVMRYKKKERQSNTSDKEKKQETVLLNATSSWK